MATYDLIKIIYNPVSTGPGEQLAQQLRDRLESEMPGQLIELQPTARPGHGEELAYTTALAHGNTLVISVSGDGGYHDVINGIMRAQREGAQAVAGLMPAGNANDHYRETTNDDFVGDIVKRRSQLRDVLQLEAMVGGEPFTRYAHSYIGLGLTPKVGRELNKTDLNRWREVGIVCKAVWRLKPVRVRVGSAVCSYDSILCSNIGTMSKVFTIAESARSDDGKFELTLIPAQGRLRLFKAMMQAAIASFEEVKRVDRYEFETIASTLVQCDGEVVKLDAKTAVSVTVRPRSIESII